MSVKAVRKAFERLQGAKESKLQNIDRLESKIIKNESKLFNLEKAREIVKQVGLRTQEQITYNISDISSMAMEAVLENPYELIIEFVERRNKTECDILFEKKGMVISPDSVGGGARDTASFALRVASWTMSKPKSRSVLILDEPFKHLKGDEANRNMLEMVKEISDKLGLQIIMVSDERVSRSITTEFADRLFEVSIKNGVSNVNVE